MKLPLLPMTTAAGLLVARQDAGINNTLIPWAPSPLPQIHCTSPIYCPGPLLQAVQLSGLYPDSKTFVDKPLLKSQDQVLAAFTALGDGVGGNVTYDQLQTFLTENFGQEGGDLVQADLGPEFIPEPDFLANVTNEVVRDWVKQVHGYWPILARTTNSSTSTAQPSANTTSLERSLDATLLTDPTSTLTAVAAQDPNDTVALDDASSAASSETSSFIPFKSPRTFVVPGQRFREMYYWDSYFVILGLLRSQLPSVARAMLDNFGDIIEDHGFVLNGNRVYYRNRSQPPLLTQMVDLYVNYTGDVEILQRMLPLLEKEWEWWNINRTIAVTSGYTNKTYNVTHYDVDTSAPRPESYLVDWQTVELAATEQGLNFSDTEKARLYADIASSAESGHDFSLQRWSKRPDFVGVIDANQSTPGNDKPARQPVNQAQDSISTPAQDSISTPAQDSISTPAQDSISTPQHIPLSLHKSVLPPAADPNSMTAAIPPAAPTSAALRYLNTAQQIPVDLNAILYKNELTLARFRNLTVPSTAVNVSSASVPRRRDVVAGDGNGDPVVDEGTPPPDSTYPALEPDPTLSELWSSRAAARRDAILDLHWDPRLLSFADYNLSSSSRSIRWSASNLWPFWAGILPDEFTDDSKPIEARGILLESAFAGVRYLIDRYNGSLATTLVATGQQWDFPNVWAPHTQIVIDALRSLPADLVQAGGPRMPAPKGSWALIPSTRPSADKPKSHLKEKGKAKVALEPSSRHHAGGGMTSNAPASFINQLGVSDVSQLPLQPLATNPNVSAHTSEESIGQTSPTSGLDYLSPPPPNIGNITLNPQGEEELWTDTLVRALANRFVASALCSWYITGGVLNLSDPGAKERWSPISTSSSSPLPTSTDPPPSSSSAQAQGHMFEKFSQLSTSSPGAGGEYEVQVGFGWTNALSIWLSAEFGSELSEPECN